MSNRKVHHLVCADPKCEKEFTWQWGNPEKGRIPVRCPECRERDPKGRELDKLRATTSDSVRKSAGRFGKGDQAELDFIQEKMGLSQAEAIKTSIRVYAALLRRG